MSTSDDIPELSVVRLTETVEGIEAGSYGTVVHVYQGGTLAETGYAVEFSNPSRVVVVARSQIEPEVWTEEDLRAADAKAEELHRFFHPEEYTASPAVVDHTERARRVIALVENCAGDTALLVRAVAAEFSAATSEPTIAVVHRDWAKAVAAAKEEKHAALLARLQDPAVREEVIDTLMTTNGWVSSFPGQLRLAATALTDAAIAKIKEMLK